MRVFLFWSEAGKLKFATKTARKKKKRKTAKKNRARGPYRGILPLVRFRTDLAALGPYCHDLGPIFPSTALELS